MRYHTPKSFDEATAIAARASGVTRFLAGGTDVLVQLRAGMVTPDDLIDLKHIPEVKGITRTAAGGWRIGIAVSGAELGRHEALCADWPGVVEGMNLVGSTQVQGRATLVGNLCNGSPAAAAAGPPGRHLASRADWARATAYYRLAAHVLPRSGNPHNQLAVMAFWSGDELKAAYHYARSLCVRAPFTTAHENLLQLLQNNRTRYAALCQGREAQAREAPVQAPAQQAQGQQREQQV